MIMLTVPHKNHSINGILNVYVWKAVSRALRGESPIVWLLLAFMGDAPTHRFHENTSVQYIKKADRQSEDNQTFSFFFLFLPSLYSDGQKDTPCIHTKIDEFFPQQRQYGN